MLGYNGTATMETLQADSVEAKMHQPGNQNMFAILRPLCLQRHGERLQRLQDAIDAIAASHRHTNLGLCLEGKKA